ncbi:MAG: putative hydroxymethylpyrimidine transporter CytX [Chloroflexota bacterium]|nr:putative hydroxymethylpyrimidine transporter CytX [Chloroflexota bacterium]
MAVSLHHMREFGIEPVPVQHRVLGVRDNFVLWADLGISFLVMVVGMFLVPGLGFWQAMLAIVVGATIGNLLLGLAAMVGSDTGLPTMVLLRAPLGRLGSYVPTVVNVLQLLGWATFEVIVMSQAADLLATRLGAPSAYHAWVVFFTALTLLLALGGPVLVTKQWMEKFAVWAVLLSTVWITVALLSSYDVSAILSRPGTGEMSFWLAVDLVVALPISWFPLVADYSRFSRNRRSAFWGTAVGYFVPQVWFYALGALLVLVVGVASDPDAPIAPLLAAIGGLTAGWAALLILLLDETDEGFANVYSTAVSIQNLAPRLRQRWLIVAICLVVLVVASLVPLAQYESFLLLIGAAFVPLLAVLCADYFVLHGQRYDATALSRSDGPATVRWGAVAAWVVGIATYLLISGVPPFGIQGLAPWLGSSLPSFVVTFALYMALERAVLRRGLPRAGAASA